MKYKYVEDQSLMNNDLREAFKRFSKKTNDGKPVLIPNSYNESIEFLRESIKKYPEINARIIDSLEIRPRTNFFSWNTIPQNIREQLINPYTFLAVPFTTENDTIPSIHNILLRGNMLDIDPSDKILVFGSKSAYDAIVFSELIEDGKIFAFEPNERLNPIGKKNIKTSKLERKIKSLINLEQLENKVDKITTTYAFRTTDTIERLLDYLKEGGMARLSVARVGNCPKPSQAGYWRPGQNLDFQDIHIKMDYTKNMVRATTYVFVKDDENTIRYGFNRVGRLSPLFHESTLN